MSSFADQDVASLCKTCISMRKHPSLMVDGYKVECTPKYYIKKLYS
jgi:hypothetical protein